MNFYLLEPEKNPFNFKPISDGTVGYRNLDLPERNTFTYVCGYIMKKCLEKHICQHCIDYVIKNSWTSLIYYLSLKLIPLATTQHFET